MQLLQTGAALQAFHCADLIVLDVQLLQLPQIAKALQLAYAIVLQP